MHTNGLTMENQTNNLNSEVTNFLDELNHPFRKEIEQLRNLILTANNNLTENIKWDNEKKGKIQSNSK